MRFTAGLLPRVHRGGNTLLQHAAAGRVSAV